MRGLMRLLVCVSFLIGGIFFVATSANATIALCVGCTSSGQFQGAAWQATGTSFIGDQVVLVVNPSSGQSQWVRLTHYPPGISIRAVPARAPIGAVIEPGTAAPVNSDPFSAIYIAGDSAPHLDSAGISRAISTAVAPAEQAAISTAIQITKKTWFVQLNSSEFPSYKGSQGTVQIASANYVAMSDAGVGWPVSDESKNWFDGLLKLMGLYTGHSFVVCDVFGNGDSVCTVPDPFDKDLYTQTGPAKDANGNELPDIGNRVAGGGGEGMGVTRSPGQVTYFPGGGGGGGGGVTCAYVNGVIQYCLLKVE